MEHVRKLLVLAGTCAAVLLPLRVIAQDAGDRGVVLVARIDSLRTEGKFAEALKGAIELLDLRQTDPSAKLFEIADAGRLVATFEAATGLPVTDQQELAKAYGMNAEIAADRNKGEYGEGVPVAETQLAIFREVLGNDHLDVAMSLNNVGGLLYYRGENAGAEALYRDALAIYQRV